MKDGFIGDAATVPDREITKAITAAQSAREALRNICDDARLSADRLLGIEGVGPEVATASPPNCPDGDIHELSFTMAEIGDQIDALRRQVLRLMRV